MTEHLSQPDGFPFAAHTPNQLSPEQRDKAYAWMHQQPYGTYSRTTYPGENIQLVWGFEDVAFCMQHLSVDSSLDPLGGYGRLFRNINPIFEFGAGLFPLPARATANLSGPKHQHVWDALAGAGKEGQTPGFMRIDHRNRDSFLNRFKQHFHEAFDSLGLGDQAAPGSVIDITGKLAPRFAARIVCDLTGIPIEKVADLQLQSEGQSGLLGQVYNWGDRAIQATAVRHLNSLFSDTKRTVREAIENQGRIDAGDPQYSLATHLLDAGLPPKIVVSAIANCKAAGIFTMAYSIGNALNRIVKQELYDNLIEPSVARKLGSRALLIDPGLSAWKRYASKDNVALPSGTILQKGAVLAMIAAANHDPQYFEHQGDLTAPTRAGIEFGPKDGEHRCPGESVARMAQTVFLESFRERVGALTLLKSNPKHPGATPDTTYPSRPDLLFTGTNTVLQVA